MVYKQVWIFLWILNQVICAVFHRFDSHGCFRFCVSNTFVVSPLTEKSTVKHMYVSSSLASNILHQFVDFIGNIVVPGSMCTVGQVYYFSYIKLASCCFCPFPRAQRAHCRSTQLLTGPFTLYSRACMEHWFSWLHLWCLCQLPPASIQQAFPSIFTWKRCGSFRLFW
jgi:hypothetical protein